MRNSVIYTGNLMLLVSEIWAVHAGRMVIQEILVE
jgi:hypothetical protein